MDQLKLHNQVCFPVYTLAKEIVNRYRPFLQDLDLTYPQYLVMLVLWEKDGQTVSQIGEKLNLDSGTLTPLLKRLEQKKIIARSRSEKDERTVIISLTASGESLKDKAQNVPSQLVGSLSISVDELQKLRRIIDQILSNI
ncbi:MarR family winged helix-turn-helix transcriptional regulator [Sphingobacterium sp. FBM7-1]|jgi:DNA-binding MarR family transcriptional regulator|uniref:MarR family winged helix-turn-helix transcriptional regulator n=1 Tax=Sphingobacterium sp. FBM7-1 TaxID=2886688 RepID=UPI001D11EA76|nr:MarR family transcriptional regulator [Sphingobacterium sp. FBM7-1]MCC2598504.1 MarR family transcriptional regulator [Sphingobacterium sp. FBM7-1]